MLKTILLALFCLIIILNNSGCGSAEATPLNENKLIFSTDSLQYEMAAQLCDNKNWDGAVCPALLTLTQDLDAGVYARYPSTELAASSEVSRMVLRVIAMDSLETVTHFQEVLSMEK